MEAGSSDQQLWLKCKEETTEPLPRSQAAEPAVCTCTARTREGALQPSPQTLALTSHSQLGSFSPSACPLFSLRAVSLDLSPHFQLLPSWTVNVFLGTSPFLL